MNQLNYYSRYNRVKKPNPKSSLLAPLPINVVSAYHNYKNIPTNEQSINQPQQIADPFSFQQIASPLQTPKNETIEKPQINIVHTFSVQEDLSSDEQSQVIKTKPFQHHYQQEDSLKCDEIEDSFQTSHFINRRKASTELINEKVPYLERQLSKSEKIIRIPNLDIQVQEITLSKKEDQQLQFSQNQYQLEIERQAHKFQLSTKMIEDMVECRSQIETIKQVDRKCFKKFMINKKLNPRLVTSTILNDEKPQKVNFKKILKRNSTEQNVKRCHERVDGLKMGSTQHKWLLKAFFEQN